MTELEIALLLGVVEGITEFLPVSSTGHLILTDALIGGGADQDHAFEIFIQGGAILAVVLLYWRRFLGLLSFSKTPVSTFAGWHGLLRLAVVCAPAAAVGFLFSKQIKALLFSPLPIAIALIAGGVVMLLVERRSPVTTVTQIEQISVRQALIIGLVQCLALWPGISRSGATIIGGMLCGLSRSVAAEFSFLAAVPLLSAAALHEFLKVYSTLTPEALQLYGIGFGVSFLCAMLAIRVLVSMLKRWSMVPFAWYRIALGVVVLVIVGR